MNLSVCQTIYTLPKQVRTYYVTDSQLRKLVSVIFLLVLIFLNNLQMFLCISLYGSEKLK